MDTDIKQQWIYVVVQEPETASEELMGFVPSSNSSVKEAFIPAFETKEEAQQCFLLMPKDLLQRKYEIQAIIRDDLISYAKTNGYRVFIMDEKSCIKKEIL